MIGKIFEYKGLVFEAYKTLKSNDYVKTMRKCRKSNITPEGYDYHEFYKLAKKNDACTDLYKVNDCIVIPGSSCIFYYDEKCKG